jgi:hypothetical protein
MCFQNTHSLSGEAGFIWMSADYTARIVFQYGMEWCCIWSGIATFRCIYVMRLFQLIIIS